ncbi:hypothetical protein AU210_016438 [Fusarium oxysporum f. sp. radicis-cucumerinum]|uniref:ferric-chelate reductase (NADPH) n=1 Tax=Fusarium oxysporum f. sp. radicis-cucumerinum TaxID=327505 RepID=A0A2H3FS04_FUSOX|nr:hypothetical protein AU210_016438 [Fusarium oxysporum f. sp. radicis-cucumerinum]
MQQDHSAAAPLVYAIVLGSLVLFIIFRSLLQVAFELFFGPISSIWEAKRAHPFTLRLRNWVAKHFIYKSFFSRASFHSRGWSFAIALYVTASLCCVLVKAADTAEVGVRAGHVALINLLLLFTGPCLHFAADVAGFSLRTQKQIHAAAGYTVAIVATIHTFALLSRTQSFPVATPSNLFAILSISAILLLLVPISPLSRFLPYELLLLIHHVLPYFLGYFVWRHIPHKNLLPRLYTYILLGVFALALLAQLTITLIRCRFWFHSARISCRLGFVKITLHLRKPLRIRPGQYIDLWIPSSVGSIFQSHPMSVVSWSSGPQRLLFLCAQVQNGFTSTLLTQVKYGDTTSIAMFTGPHGVTLPLHSYDQVLLIATDLGVVALLPYMQCLAYESHFIGSRTKRIHLVWRLKDWSLIQVLKAPLNAVLETDESGGDIREGTFTRILESVISISIYGQSDKTNDDEEALKVLKESSRVELQCGQWNLSAVVEKDTASSNVSLGHSGKASAIAASVSPDIRAELNDIVKKNIQHVDLMYTDYQPEGYRDDRKE